MATKSFEASYRVVELFFDRAKVLEKIDRANKRGLSRAGSFVRRRARTDILRRRKAIAAPGRPPSVRSRDKVATLKNILFFYDPKIDAVVVGPVKLNQRNNTNHGNISIPALHELGGSMSIDEMQFAGQSTDQWFRADLRRSKRPGERRRRRTAVYEPRPFMRAALSAEVADGNIPKAWANSVRE